MSGMRTLLTGALAGLFCWAGQAAASVYVEPDEASNHPMWNYQGEYAGTVKLGDDAEPVQVWLQIAIYGDDQVHAVLLESKPPQDLQELPDEAAYHTLTGQYADYTLRLEGDYPLSFQHIHGRLIALGEDYGYRGRLEPVNRQSVTFDLEPPDDAVVLFDASDPSLEHWDAQTQLSDDGLLIEGATTAQAYGDMRLHVTARLPFMPEARGQNRANSGIYIQNRYEVQILDSFGNPPTIDGNASLYREAAPRLNTSLPPLNWQTYDVYFRAPRFDDQGQKTENARITVYLNGHLVIDDVQLEQGTGAGGQRDEVAEGELYLQDHGDPVRFRNVWIVPGAYDPPGVMHLQMAALAAGQTLNLDAAADAQHIGRVATDSSHSGYTGAGFVDFLEDGAEQAATRWSFEVPESTRYEVSFRYALGGGGNRALDLVVNDELLEHALDFEPTGGWSQWQRVTRTVELEAGQVSVTLRQFNGRGPNVDRLELRKLD